MFGQDKPPGLPDAFGLNNVLRKAVTGGELTGGVQGQGGARDNSMPEAAKAFAPSRR